MKYWIISGNVNNNRKNLEEWFTYLREKKIAVMGWSDENWYGKAFKDKVAVGDMIVVAQGSNANKRLCVAGIVKDDAESGKLDNAPGEYETYRHLEPAIVLKDEPSSYGITFKDAAYGDSSRPPSLYQLYPLRNEADRRIVLKMHELLGIKATDFAEDEGDELVELIDEFKRSYMDAGDGEYHKKLLLQGREQGKKNYEKVIQLQKEGKDITDAVLYGLLPHQDTQQNREKGHWIHVAPCVTKDIKEWFEGAGWARHEEWSEIAKQLFGFIQKAVENPQDFRSLCNNFDKTFPHKGFQVGMLSPILNVLSPDNYLVVNKKPVMVINWLSNANFQAHIKDMPDIIASMKKWVEENKLLLEPLTPEGLSIFDTFDIFCHWVKAVKKFPLKKSTGASNERRDLYGRGNFEAAETVIKKIFANESIRNAAIQFAIECIQRAHAKNTNNWEVTLRPRSIALNVGFCRIFRFHLSELSFFLLGSAFPAELREKYADIVTFDEKPFKSIDEEIGKCIIAPEKLIDALSDIKYAIFEFIDLAGSKSKSSIWASSHSPGVLEYFRNTFAKELPSPDYEEQIIEAISEDEDTEYGEAKQTTEENEADRVEESTAETSSGTSYWWLNANPKIWDIVAPPIGTRQTYTSHNANGNKRRVYQYFKQVKPGDLLLGYVASPIRQVAALCRVTKGLHQSDEGEVFEFEKVEQFPEPISLKELQSQKELKDCEPLINNQGSLFKLRPEEYEVIRGIIDAANEDAVVHGISEPFTIEQVVNATGFSIDRIDYWKGAIERKKQAVFYGPPGTGKTWIAEHLAKHIVGGTDGIVDCIQFHPAYTYEEFMQGIRPDTTDKGNLQFELKPGRFLEFCVKARQRKSPCVLIIDEINRANLARVFGELMYLLEYREKDMPLAGGLRFSIPENVRIIGTMNTADRSIALVDFALRRRFAFLELAPEYDLLLEFQRKGGFNAEGLVNTLKDVNAKINDKNFYLGISFFMIDDLSMKIEEIWRMEIETYLEEYFFSQPEAIVGFRWDKIKERVLS